MMPIATDDQVKALDASLAESEARPLLERLADPRTHRPTKLREEARARISELEARIEVADAVARRLMIEAARDQPSVVAVGKALDQVRVVLRDGCSHADVSVYQGDVVRMRVCDLCGKILPRETT